MSYKTATAERQVAVGALGFESYGETTSLIINITEDTANDLTKQKRRSARPNMHEAVFEPRRQRAPVMRCPDRSVVLLFNDSSPSRRQMMLVPRFANSFVYSKCRQVLRVCVTVPRPVG